MAGGRPAGDGRLLDVLCSGILVADMIAGPLEALPRPGELVLVDDVPVTTGGCAANVAVSLAKLGARVAVAGKVGSDAFGRAVVDDLARRGLDISGIRSVPGVATSKTVILPVRGDDRRYVHAVGANAHFGAADVDRDLIARSRVFYVGGLLAMPALHASELFPLLAHARASGSLTVLDVVVSGRQPPDLAGFAELLSLVDVFLPNDTEGRLLSGEDDPHAQAEYFAVLGARTVVITLGEQGCIIRTDNRVVRAGAYAVDVVDPSGSGDAFAAGYLFGLLNGWDLDRTVRLAAAMGAAACTALGCTAGTFDLAGALDFMARHTLAVEEVT